MFFYAPLRESSADIFQLLRLKCGCFNPLATSIRRINKCWLLSAITVFLNIYLDKQHGKRNLHVILRCVQKVHRSTIYCYKKNKKWGKQLRILLNVWIYSLLKYNASAAESETWILNI